MNVKQSAEYPTSQGVGEIGIVSPVLTVLA